MRARLLAAAFLAFCSRSAACFASVTARSLPLVSVSAKKPPIRLPIPPLVVRGGLSTFSRADEPPPPNILRSIGRCRPFSRALRRSSALAFLASAAAFLAFCLSTFFMWSAFNWAGVFLVIVRGMRGVLTGLGGFIALALVPNNLKAPHIPNRKRPILSRKLCMPSTIPGTFSNNLGNIAKPVRANRPNKSLAKLPPSFSPPDPAPRPPILKLEIAKSNSLWRRQSSNSLSLLSDSGICWVTNNPLICCTSSLIWKSKEVFNKPVSLWEEPPPRPRPERPPNKYAAVARAGAKPVLRARAPPRPFALLKPKRPVALVAAQAPLPANFAPPRAPLPKPLPRADNIISYL